MTVYDHDDSIAHSLGIDPSTGMQVVYDRNRPGAINLDPVAIRLTDIAPKAMGWVWPGWIPAGMLTILGGHVGDGKSTVIAALVAALTTGAPLPDGTTVEPANVLILGQEDDPARVLRPRLDANHADPERIFLLDPTTRTRRDLRTDAWFLRDIIREHKIGLVVIDPLGDVLRRSDRASEGDIRTELEPLMKVIDATGVAVVGVMRVGKGSMRRPAQSLVGSSVIPAIARSVIMLAPVVVPDTADRVILQVVKSNTGKPPQAVALEIDGSGVVTWLGTVEEGIDEQLGDPRLGTTERREAARFLKDLLADGPMPATMVLRQARNVGFSEITIRRAKKDLSIRSYREQRIDGKWRWCLPGDEGKVRHGYEMGGSLEFETKQDLEEWLDIIIGDLDELEFDYNLDKLVNTGIDWLEIDEDELLELLEQSGADDAADDRASGETGDLGGEVTDIA